MSEHKQALYFKSPVEEIWPQLKDAYFRLVQQPMDMRTVTDRLRLPAVDGQSYTSPWQFFRDMNLIFENALVFNIPNDAVYRSAEFMQKQFRSRHWPKCRQRMEKAGLNLQHPHWAPPSEAAPCLPQAEAPHGNGLLAQPSGAPTAAEPRGGGGGSSGSRVVRTGSSHCSLELRAPPVQDDAARAEPTELLQAEHVGVLAVSTWLLCSAGPALQQHHQRRAFPPRAPGGQAGGGGSRAWLLLTAAALTARLSMALQAARHLPAVAAAEEQLLRAFREPIPGRSWPCARLPSVGPRPEGLGAAAAAGSERTPPGGGKGAMMQQRDEAARADTTAAAAAAPPSAPASDALLQPAAAPRAHHLEEAAGLLEASSGALREVAEDMRLLLEHFGWDADVRFAVGACQEELEAGRQLLEQVRASVADELGLNRCRPDTDAGCQRPPSVADAALLLQQLPDLLQPKPGEEEGEALRQLMALLREQQQHMEARERLRLLSNRLRLRGVDPDMLLRSTSAAAGRDSRETTG